MTAPPQTLEQQARAVALLRLTYADVDGARRRAEEHFKHEYAGLLQRHRETGQALDEAEGALRIAAVNAYRDSLNRAPCPGVTIRIFTKVRYELSHALAWAKSKGVALKLDEKAFEALAKASADGDLPATLHEEPHAQISETLAELLGVTLPPLAEEEDP